RSPWPPPFPYTPLFRSPARPGPPRAASARTWTWSSAPSPAAAVPHRQRVAARDQVDGGALQRDPDQDTLFQQRRGGVRTESGDRSEEHTSELQSRENLV